MQHCTYVYHTNVIKFFRLYFIGDNNMQVFFLRKGETKAVSYQDCKPNYPLSQSCLWHTTLCVFPSDVFCIPGLDGAKLCKVTEYGFMA